MRTHERRRIFGEQFSQEPRQRPFISHKAARYVRTSLPRGKHRAFLRDSMSGQMRLRMLDHARAAIAEKIAV